MADAVDQPPCYRLEFAAVTRRKCGGITGFGFALFQNHTNHLVATGGGPVQSAVTFNQAVLLALLEGLKVAQALGASNLLLQTDSSMAFKQLDKLTGPSPPQHEANVVLAAVADALGEVQQAQVQQVDRWANGMAIIQAEFATELLLLLPKVACCPPSKYAHLAGQIGTLLLLPVTLRRIMEAADNFTETTAEVVALRCGTSKQDLLNVIHNRQEQAAASQDDDNSGGYTINSSSNTNEGGNNNTNEGGSSTGVGPLIPEWSPFVMRRIFSEQEGAAYAAAAAAAAAEEAQPNSGAADDAAPKRQKLVAGRVVGRHRLDHKYLVVGFHHMPDGWVPGQPLQQQQTEQALLEHPQLPQVEPAVLPGVQQPQQQHNTQPTSTSAAPAPAAGGAPAQPPLPDPLAAAAGGSADDVLLPAWKGRSGAASTSEAVGLGTGRYSLPHVSSDTATHLLQFDGASRNNPGRGGYGYVIFDLTGGNLVERGCMSLPYGQTAGRAEFEGLLAGLRAALNLGIRTLAVQGDSALVLDAMMYRRGISSQHIGMTYQKAVQLLGRFDHVDFQYIPREQNSMADRLANMSMDIDTALYALLRKDERGVAGLKVVTKAARMAKRLDALQQLLEQYDFPLLLVVLLQRVMAISPQQLLQRLQDKALRLGDPNPWLVQEVRKLAEGGIPRALAEEVAAAVMDTRYTTAATRAIMRRAAAHRQQQQTAPKAAASSPGQTQQWRQYSGLPAAAAAPAAVGYSSSHVLPACGPLASALWERHSVLQLKHVLLQPSIWRRQAHSQPSHMTVNSTAVSCRPSGSGGRSPSRVAALLQGSSMSRWVADGVVERQAAVQQQGLTCTSSFCSCSSSSSSVSKWARWAVSKLRLV